MLLKCRGTCGRFWHPGCLSDKGKNYSHYLGISCANAKSLSPSLETDNLNTFTCRDCRNKKRICNACGGYENNETLGTMYSCQVGLNISGSILLLVSR